MQNLEKLLIELNKKMEFSNQLAYCNLMSNIIANSKIDENDKQILFLLLQDRDRNYIRINHNEQVFENISRYLKLIQPLEISNNDLVRIGGKNDGGYVMYNGGGALKISNAKALSLGVSESSPWDLEMANLGFKVIEYDASIDKSPYNHENIVFHKKFIGNINSENMITLSQVLQDNNLDKNKVNILQCDIENAEWEMLESINIKTLSEYFTQVIFEFHGCNPEEQEGVELRTKQLNRLKEYFVPIHTHLNNHGKIFYSQGLFWSTTIEVSYLRKDLLAKYCLNDIGLRTNAGTMDKLDYPTFLPNPEIPLRFKRKN